MTDRDKPAGKRCASVKPGATSTNLVCHGHDRLLDTVAHLPTPLRIEDGPFPRRGLRVLLLSGREIKLNQNAVKKVREKLLISKAELARKAGVSPITIDRVEKGMDCRMETKRKILLALGFDLSDKNKLFPSS